KKALFLCQCGNNKLLSYKDANNQKTCGECNKVHIKNGERFGNLVYIGSDDYIFPFSSRIVSLRCGCGSLCKKQLQYLYYSKVVRCGNCYFKIKSWYDKYYHLIKLANHPSF